MTSKPCPPSINKIPVCCEYYEPCSSECEDEACEELEEEGYEEIEAAGGHVQSVKRHCRKVPKKRLKPCIRRSQIPGARPPQQFEERRPCRKLHPKPCRRRCRRRNQTEESGKNSNDEGKDEEEDGEDGCEDNESGDGFAGNDGEDERGKDSEFGNDDNEGFNKGELFGGKHRCRKKKKKMKKLPCKAINLTFPEDESPLFPNLPMPNLGEKPPVQKFPPAEDKDSADKKRGFPCGRKRNKRKPCKRRVGSSTSSSCTMSSSDED